MNERDTMLKESFDFIANNLKVNFDKIPHHLLRAWYFDSKSDDEDQHQFAWTIFTYVLICYKKSQGLVEFTESEERLTKLFSDWQFSLALAEINAHTDIQIVPFNIFDVENLGKIKVGMSSNKGPK